MAYDESTLEYQKTRSDFPPFPYSFSFIIGTRASDGDSVGCYIITDTKLLAGSIVECEPMGLLKQIEGGEIDHKVLAALPGKQVILDRDVFSKIKNFIFAIVIKFPDVNITIGNILPRGEALRRIQENLEG